ncbi:MAG: OB-fold putative lipoprotein [Prevotella sp.]|nr:OB-fold putative lipoprotein [Prevotella sp.]
MYQTKFSAADIHAAFVNDRNRAYKVFFSEHVEVSGEISYIGPDRYDRPSIEMGGNHYNGSQVVFIFTSGYDKNVTIEKNQNVTISGECRGALQNGTVVIENCKIL